MNKYLKDEDLTKELIRKPTFHLVLIAMLACIAVIFHSCSKVFIESDRERTKRHKNFFGPKEGK